MNNSTGAVTYSYDEQNRLTGLRDQASRSYVFDYDVAGRLVRQAYPNGTYATLAYDPAGQLTDQVHRVAGGSAFGENTYVRDPNGNITGWGGADGNVRAFAYDENSRVTKAQSTLPAVGTEAFAYDQAGNWTPYEGRLHDAANELTEDALFTYAYDLDGNLTQKQAKFDASDLTTYQWDPLNRLTQVSRRGHVISYRYDGLGRRIAKVIDGLETRYVLDGQNVVEERDGSNALLAVNLHAGLDHLLARQDYVAGTSYWVHADHLGSVEALTDATGAVVERYRYSAYGQISVLGADFSARSGLPLQPFAYTGREWEPEVGLSYHRARFMDPRLGRWLSRDPIGQNGGINLYAYVENNPNNRIDPDGTFWWVAIGAAAGGVINGYKHWDEWQKGTISTGQFLSSVGVGAVTGALSTLAPGFGGGLALGATTAFGNSLADQAITTGRIELREAMKDTGWGLVGGTGAYFGGKAVASAANRYLWDGTARSGGMFSAGYDGLFNTAKTAGEFTGAMTNAVANYVTTDQVKCKGTK